MALTDHWINEHYEELMAEYAGRWVLIKENKVIFADKRFEIVYKKAKSLGLLPEECVIRRIDSGDAALYAFKVQDKKIKSV